MTDIDVIIEKTNSIQNCLQRIKETIDGDINSLDNNFNIQDILTLKLQRAIQLVLDMASHIVSSKRLGVPQTLRDVFVILEKNKIINHQLSIKMQKMVGFRNIAVHDYQAINADILKSIVAFHLQDLEEFYRVILTDLQT